MVPLADAPPSPLRDSLAGAVLRGTDQVTYHLRDCVGEGGQGWVFRANWDDPSGHVVIVKVLRPDMVGTEGLLRFQREADVLRRLSTQGRPNPYVVRFYDHAVASVSVPGLPQTVQLPFTVMEYVDGPTLEAVLEPEDDRPKRGLAPERVRRLLRQICQALDLVHAQKIVHRDLKPSNILLATEAGIEIAKVTDFGLVKLVDTSLQRTSALAGASLGYAPPEQYERGNQRVSPRTDVFSLAAVVYEMLAGKPAFPFNPAENPLIIVTRILNGVRPKLAGTLATLPGDLQGKPDLIDALDRELQRALSADPNARHETAMEFFGAVEPALRAASDTSETPRLRSRAHVSPFETTARVNEPPRSDAARGLGPSVRISSPVGLGTPESGVPAISARSASSPQVAAASGASSAVPEARAMNPSAWRWTTLTKPLGPGAVRGISFSPRGDVAVGVGSAGLLRWERGAWTPLALPPDVPAFLVRAVHHLRDDAVLVFGERGLAVVHTLAGQTTRLAVPDRTITFHGALLEPNGLLTLVGERPFHGRAPRNVVEKTAGVVVQFNGERLTIVSDALHTARLNAVARLATGQLVTCGDWGTLARVEMGVVESLGNVCAGHLLALAPSRDGGAITVGAGGHALSLAPDLVAELEPVQTTQDLLAVAVGHDGTAWAGAANGRLLRRSRPGGGAAKTWIRMGKELEATGTYLAVTTSSSAGASSVRAATDDGAVVEGHLA